MESDRKVKGATKEGKRGKEEKKRKDKITYRGRRKGN